MKLNALLINGLLTLAVTAAPAVLFAAPKSGTVERDDVLQLLKDFQDTAASAATHADELQAIARDPNSDWQIHASKFTYLKDDINEMGRIAASLENVRTKSTDWEKKAIDEALPILKEMATNTNSAMNYLNENRTRLFLPVYDKWVNNLAGESERLSASLNSYVQFAVVHGKEDHLEKTLGISGGSH